MKISRLLFIATCLIAISCINTSKDVSLKTETEIYLPLSLKVNDTITSIFKRYLDYIDDKSVIYQLFVEQKSDTTKLILSFALFKEELEKFDPSGYFKIDGNLFLVYFGHSGFSNENSDFRFHINTEIKTKPLKSVFAKSFRIIDCQSWIILVSKEGKVHKIKRTSFKAYGLPKSL
jgi:hypothetical protein